MIEEPGIILITGNMASGKSSVAQALAERLPKSVHLRGDVFRRMIVSGQAPMTVNLSEEAERQLEVATHDVRKQQLRQALAEIEKRLKALANSRT